MFVLSSSARPSSFESQTIKSLNANHPSLEYFLKMGSVVEN